MIITHGTEYILELQNNGKSEGILCVEKIIVRIHDEGGGPFLSIKTENLEPTDEYDNHTVTLGEKDIQDLCVALENIVASFKKGEINGR